MADCWCKGRLLWPQNKKSKQSTCDSIGARAGVAVVPLKTELQFAPMLSRSIVDTPAASPFGGDHGMAWHGIGKNSYFKNLRITGSTMWETTNQPVSIAGF